MKIREFPYPFRAALAVCSDIDNCDLDTFIAIHQFINSEKYGLGLPVADSFFGVAKDQAHMAYFNPDGSSRPREAEFIRQAIQDGLIDSLHSWGDFNDAPPNPLFLQTIARQLTEELTKVGLEVPIWINHGSPNNHQNLIARLWPQYQGDDPHSPLYTAKFAKKIGIKYHWWSEIVQWPLSSARQRISGKELQRITLNHFKNMVKILLGKSTRIKTSDTVTDLMKTITLRDGSPLIAFTRFAQHPNRADLWGAGPNSLRHSLAKKILDELIQQQGYIIIYTHLAKAVIQDQGKIFFPSEEEEVLNCLADYYKKKLIWVTPTAKLLQYKNVHDFLEWQVVREKKKIIIKINGLKDPVEGKRIPSVDELAGICFYTPIARDTYIQLRDQKVATELFGLESTGSGWIGFPPPLPPKTELIDYS
ncbi:MAG: hypothetical protein Q3M24_10280 [Candidatus Electrothrix aestuarii]|uniref:Uncharacterized protein n=1 Tax=Candidatus Electrothrix aestuarii TaxID=3062594 RepID=A0AAU8M0Z7_9BACT